MDIRKFFKRSASDDDTEPSQQSPCKRLSLFQKQSKDEAPSSSSTSVLTSNHHVDIFNCKSKMLSYEEKFHLISNRMPLSTFKFPSKQYKDSRRQSGFMFRSCRRDWLEKFDFLSYSESTDSVFCLPCVLFPTSTHRLCKKLISEPYHN